MTISPPEIGQAVRIRNRLATAKAVESYDSYSTEGVLHLVDIEYLDDSKITETDQLLWEVETGCKILGTTSLPQVYDKYPDNPNTLNAFINSQKWSRLNRLKSIGDTNHPIMSV